MFESATADRAIIALWAFPESDDRDTAPTPKTARIEVHRLVGIEAAIAAFGQVRAAPRWARQTAVALVPTKGLARVAALDAKLHDVDGTLWFQLPKRLDAGWYLITVRSGTRPVQTVLQVTDIAGYLVVTDTKTLVWANDVGSGRPVAGATVASDGVALGRTGADGTGIVDTPVRLKTAPGEPCTKASFASDHRPIRGSRDLPAGDCSEPTRRRDLRAGSGIGFGRQLLDDRRHRSCHLSPDRHGQHLGPGTRARHGRGPGLGHGSPARRRRGRGVGRRRPAGNQRSPPERDRRILGIDRPR